MPDSSDETTQSGGYRIKFKKDEFLRLLREASPKRVYMVKKFYYFSLDGFVIYTEDVKNDEMMNYIIFHGIEFSNLPWVKK